VRGERIPTTARRAHPFSSPLSPSSSSLQHNVLRRVFPTTTHTHVFHFHCLHSQLLLPLHPLPRSCFQALAREFPAVRGTQQHHIQRRACECDEHEPRDTNVAYESCERHATIMF
jgi:hypothetical protein